MKNVLTLLFFLSISTLSFSQYILKGKVTNLSDEPIPGVRVFIENTTYGVITDVKGQYFIELNKAGTYPIAFRMIGFKDSTYKVIIQNKTSELNVSMASLSTELSTVDVYADKADIAKGIIKKVQDNRKQMAAQFKNYTCKTYQKTGLEKERRTFSLNSETDSSEMAKSREKMNLIESLAESSFISPNIYHEKILAYHDYSDKIENVATSSVDFTTVYAEEVAPVQTVMVNPYIFFEKIEDGDFNLYQNMINLPKISEHPITSPVGVQAFANYKFGLKDVFFENGQKIYEIQVTPRFKAAPLLSGSIFIIDQIWVIKSFNLKVNPTAMPFFRDFAVIHDYSKIEDYWVPVRREYIYTINDELHVISANTRVNHSEYQFNRDIEAKDFKNEIMHYDEYAFDRDSVFWLKSRPIQLKEKELEYIEIQKRIEARENSEPYLDSVQKAYNKVNIWEVILSGVGYKNRFRQNEFYVYPLLGSFDIFGVGGVRLRTGGYYRKTFDNTQSIKISPFIDYGTRNKDVKGRLGIDYMFDPLHFGAIDVNVGDMYDFVTTETAIINLVNRNNYVRKQYIDLAYRREIVNGLYGKIKFGYSDRRSIDGLIFSPWEDTLAAIAQLDTVSGLGNFFKDFNNPVQFERYKISFVEFRLQYRFKQKYIIRGNEKLIIGTKYPELEFLYRKGIPGLFNSEVNFDFVELKASDEINFGNYGDSKWKVLSGAFLNQKDLRFIEHKFFRGSDFTFFSNPLNSHQTLDSTLNTNHFYMQGFYVHHFNGFFLNKVPLINRLKLESIGGASFLTIPDADILHTEFFVGLEKKFKIKNQYLKAGLYYNTRLNNSTSAIFKLKFGMDYFNSFTNSWSY